MKTLSAPINIGLNITNKCNLRCKHCFAYPMRNNKDLTTEKLLDIIRQIIKLKVLRIAVAGGEPLMRKDFFKVLKALSKSKSIITLNTNATLITDSMAKRLSGFPIKGYLVSLDGSRPRIHDKVRGKGSFNKAVRGINNLLRYKLPVIISTTVTKINYKDLYKIALLAERLGVQKVKFDEVFCVGNAACLSKDIVLTVKDRKNLLKTAEKIKMDFPGFAAGCIFNTLEAFRRIKKPGYKKERLPLKIHPCPAGVIMCDIRPDGIVAPCGILWGVNAGDLRKNSLRDIWRNSPELKDLRKTITLTKKDIPECADCKYLAICYKGHRCYPYHLPGRSDCAAGRKYHETILKNS